VTPVTRGVADRDEQRHVVLAGALEGVVAPRLPVDRVVGVLLEVRTRLLVEAVPLRRLCHGHHSVARGKNPSHRRRAWLIPAHRIHNNGYLNPVRE